MINRIESATQRSSDAPVPPPVGSGFDTRLSLEAGTSAASDGAARAFVDDGPGGSSAVLQLDSRGRIICQCPESVAARAANATTRPTTVAPGADVAAASSARSTALLIDSWRTELLLGREQRVVN